MNRSEDIFPREDLRSELPLSSKLEKQRLLGSFQLRGVLQRGRRGNFSVNGEEFFISSETWIHGDPKPGSIVEVKGVVRQGLGLLATKVSLRPTA